MTVSTGLQHMCDAAQRSVYCVYVMVIVGVHAQSWGMCYSQCMPQYIQWQGGLDTTCQQLRLPNCLYDNG